MNKSGISLLLLFWVFIAGAQNKLLVTDFAFFNTYNTAVTPKISDTYSQDQESLEMITLKITSSLKESYDVAETNLAGKSVVFVEEEPKSSPGKSYKENHKELIKKGGYDYYLLITSSISSIGNRQEKFEFRSDIKLSNGKGKKVFSNSIKIPFTALFQNDQVASSQLISGQDFQTLLSLAITNGLSDEKGNIDEQEFYRPTDDQFSDIVEASKFYSIDQFKTYNPILLDEENNKIEIKVRGGVETDINISNAQEGILVAGEKSVPPVSISFKNPMVSNSWSCLIQEKSNSGFEDLNLAPSASIFVRIGNQSPLLLRMINGRLTGKLGSNTYMLSYEPSASLLRIFMNSELVALSQPLKSGSNDVKVFYTGEESEFANVVNLHELYFHAIDAMEKN